MINETNGEVREQDDFIILSLDVEKNGRTMKKDFVVYCTFSLFDNDYAALVAKSDLDSDRDDIEVQFMRYTISSDDVMDLTEISDDEEFESVVQEFERLENESED